MGDPIKKLTIQGFKSIRNLENFELRSLNVLIGANGAGKSNFLGFFRLLRELVEQRLQFALQTIEGGADACLYMGPKITRRFVAKLYFSHSFYEFALMPTPDNRFVFEHENAAFAEGHHNSPGFPPSGHTEAQLKFLTGLESGLPARVSYDSISGAIVYHFHDTGLTASMRRQKPINDNEFLRPDAENLAAFLYRIRETYPSNYHQIREAVRLAAPFFDDFKLRPSPTSTDSIQLEWKQKDSDYPFTANQLSDGTLRFICLATALLQPFTKLFQPSPPATMLFDEPELGLHPYALTLLASLFQQAAQHRQVIISTQSATLLNEFAPEDVIVVERHQGESRFRRLDSAELSEWLKEYALGELWQKNVLGASPQPEDAPQLVPDGDDRH
jgi:predicted ATPase